MELNLTAAFQGIVRLNSPLVQARLLKVTAFSSLFIKIFISTVRNVLGWDQGLLK